MGDKDKNRDKFYIPESNLSNDKFDVYYDWCNISKNSTEDMKRIITGHVDRFTPDSIDQFVDLIKSRGTVLDYGAGLGRNFEALSNIFNKVDYLDIKSYESLDDKILGYENRLYIDFIPSMLPKYDMIFASVVFQHIIDNESINKILDVISESTDVLLIVQNSHSRIHRETYLSKFDLIRSITIESNNASYTVSHDMMLFNSKKIINRGVV